MINDSRLAAFAKSIPLPHDPARTEYFTAGNLTIGVEYRVFDPAVERVKLTEEDVAATGQDSLFFQPNVDEGVCLHIFATAGLVEYLRFDCFKLEPHYHYILPAEGNVLVHYDAYANGPMLDWAFASIRNRLPQMLAEVGGSDLVNGLSPEALRSVFDSAESAARSGAV